MSNEQKKLKITSLFHHYPYFIYGEFTMVVWKKIRSDFPVLNRVYFGGKHIIYFDSACMALKPKPVIEAINYYYNFLGSCGGGGRSGHFLGSETTDLCEEARETMQHFINASHTNEIIWTKNTTESINTVVGALKFAPEDNIITTNLEHHSGSLPLYEKAKLDGAECRVVEVDQNGQLTLEAFEEAIDDKTKLISLVHSSNVTGTTAPIKEITKVAHDHGAKVLVDAAQSVPHMPVDVQDLNADFIVFSVHKMVGPTGMGVLYGKQEELEKLVPTSVGGETIIDVKYRDKQFFPQYLSAPERFEAGLQNYAGIIGAGAAAKYLTNIGMANIHNREKMLVKRLYNKMSQIEGIKIIGPQNSKDRSGLVTFHVPDISPKDISMYLADNVDHFTVMIRAGAHCTNPYHYSIGLNPGIGEGTARASLYFYNVPEEIDIFVDSLTEFLKIVKG